jgi:hypothetical protein
MVCRLGGLCILYSIRMVVGIAADCMYYNIRYVYVIVGKGGLYLYCSGMKAIYYIVEVTCLIKERIINEICWWDISYRVYLPPCPLANGSYVKPLSAGGILCKP